MERVKIFGIGFHKTGTSSLAKALRILGYHTIHGDSPHEEPFGDQGRSLIAQIDQGNYRLPTIERFDAFTDNPYFSIWKELDREYPKSRFILTIREEREWLDSCVRYYEQRPLLPMRVWMFGDYANPATSEAAQQRWLDAYRLHNQSIIEHFKERPSDLLVMDITKGEAWEKLCAFLGQDIPSTSFPKENTFASQSQQSFFYRGLKAIRRRAQNLLSRSWNKSRR